MIDNANKRMEQGISVAAQRISGINDNMSSSHYHPFYELYYLESGERYHLIENQLHMVTPGQFAIFEPHQFHHSYGENNVPFSRLLVYFKKEIITAEALRELMTGIGGVYHLEKKEQAELYQLMNQILKEQNKEQIFYQEVMEGLVNQLLILVLRSQRMKEQIYENNRITEIISYINLNYMHTISLDKLSRQFFISQWHLCREFKHYTHTTITQYINNIRISQAQKMLLEGHQKISEISSAVGFESLTHFERVFKQIIGTTPSAYKKMHH